MVNFLNDNLQIISHISCGLECCWCTGNQWNFQYEDFCLHLTLYTPLQPTNLSSSQTPVDLISVIQVALGHAEIVFNSILINVCFAYHHAKRAGKSIQIENDCAIFHTLAHFYGRIYISRSYMRLYKNSLLYTSAYKSCSSLTVAHCCAF